MAKKAEPLFSITPAELKKLPKGEQGRLTALGFVEGAHVGDRQDGGPEGTGRSAGGASKGNK